MTACFIRHGETDWNRKGVIQGRMDIPLNDTGKAQAKRAGLALARESWDMIISSPVGRAMETANIIGKHIGIPEIITDAALLERDFGQGEGLAYEKIKEQFGDNIPGLEPMEAVRERMFGALRNYADVYPGKRLVVVSHGAAINALLHLLSGGAVGTGVTWLLNCCLTQIRQVADGFTIDYYNKET